jgi:hypothetical protein
VISLAEHSNGISQDHHAPSLKRAAFGFVGSTFLTASLMVLLSALAG